MKYNILNIEVFCHDSHVFPFNHKYFKILPHISVYTGKFKSTIILESETDKVFADPVDMLEIVLDTLDGDINLVNSNKIQYCSTTNESKIDLKNDGILDKNNSTKKLKFETIIKIPDINNQFLIYKTNLRLRPF